MYCGRCLCKSVSSPCYPCSPACIHFLFLVLSSWQIHFSKYCHFIMFAFALDNSCGHVATSTTVIINNIKSIMFVDYRPCYAHCLSPIMIFSLLLIMRFLCLALNFHPTNCLLKQHDKYSPLSIFIHLHIPSLVLFPLLPSSASWE